MTAWHLDFARDDGLAGFVRLELREREKVAWYWTYLVGVPGIEGIVVVRDHDVPLPRPGRASLEIRTDGLWAELFCETPGEHWTFGLEAFGVRLDTAEEALRPGGEIGERVPVGLDLEWESTQRTGDDSAATGGERSVESTQRTGDDSAATGGERSVESTQRTGDDSAATGGERSVESTQRTGDDSAATGGERSVESTQQGVVHGDVLVGRARWTIDARGWFYEDGRLPPEIAGDVQLRVIIPDVAERALVRTPDGLRWTSLG